MENIMALKTTVENAGLKVLDYAKELTYNQQLLQLINRYFMVILHVFSAIEYYLEMQEAQ